MRCLIDDRKFDEYSDLLDHCIANLKTHRTWLEGLLREEYEEFY